jgi:hypothetical protein
MPMRLPVHFEKGRAKAAKSAKEKLPSSFFFATFARPLAF